ncbi:MAG TPA: portal protein [Puia sp.]|nr:portal protein [Puia sp.]
MERDPNDVNQDFDPEKLNEMEERRINRLNEAGIDESQVLVQAGKHLNIWQSYFGENITRGKDDMNFVLRDQWTAIERSEFTRLFKPAMTFNKLYDTVKKVAGEQRKNKPDLIVRSLTGKASQEQINLRADLVRTISYQSQNDLVYQTAFKSALMMGYGAFQIVLDYESPKSFNQVIRYELISDPTRTAFDPTALKPHKGDGNYCARYYVFTRDEFFATYPYVTNPVSYVDPYMLLDFQWQTRDTITVCDYFVKEWFPITIYKLAPTPEFPRGQVVNEVELEKLRKDWKVQLTITEETQEIKKMVKAMEPQIVNERQTQDYRIMHYRMIRDQIIEFSEWPSKQLPIIFVDGDSYFIEGRQYTRSFIHEARDAQKCVNYFGSEIAAEVKNRRREQWLGTPDNISGYEQDWRNPELQMGILRAKPDPKTGLMPVKQPPWDLSPAIMQNFQRATQDIREILGFSETEALQGRDISGKARRERKLEGSMSAYVFQDNMNQAVEQGGRVVNDLLPYIIGDDERTMVLSKKDGKTDSVTMNEQDREGNIKNDLGDGDFDVEINAGPSFAVQKSEALEFFQETMANNPQVFPLIADLWASNLDIEQMPTVKDRLKTLVPPEILAKEEGRPPPPPKPNPQAMMMEAEMKFKQEEIKNKQAEVQVKMQKLQLEQEEIELKKAEMFLKAQQVQDKSTAEVYSHQLDLEKARAVHGHDKHKSEIDFAHKVSSVLADLYKHDTKLEHEKKNKAKE